MIADCQNATRMAEVNSTRQTMKAVIDSFGLPMTTYEAGPSIVEQAAVQSGSITPGAATR